MKFKVLKGGRLPTRGTPGSAGYDLYCRTEGAIWDGKMAKIPLGVQAEIPTGFVGILAMRSSLAKRGVVIPNSIGVIDSDYRGELMLVLRAGHPHPLWRFAWDAGDRLCQLVVVPHLVSAPVAVDELRGTGRGEDGFGSTGSA